MPQSAIPPSRHAPIRHVWLNSCREEIIEPDLPIVDTQHHMPDQRGNRYLFQDLFADVGSGHNIVATCFMEMGGSGRLLMALQLQRVAQLQMHIGHLRLEGEGLAVRVLGLAQVLGLLQGMAVLHPCELFVGFRSSVFR